MLKVLLKKQLAEVFKSYFFDAKKNKQKASLLFYLEELKALKAAKESVEYYKKLGCGKTEDIQACEYRISQASSSSLPSVGFFSRPIENGYLVRGMSSTHKGYDFSSNNKSIGV